MRSHGKRLRGLSGLAVAVLCILASAGDGAALAQGAAATQSPLAAAAPLAPVDPADRVRGVLERFCADCVAAGLGVALSLEELAGDPSFIVPKQPDASRVYQRLLDSQTAAGNDEGADALPSPADVEAVRDWIDSLPSVDEACAGRVPVKADEVEKQADVWLKSLSEEDAADTRFISLAHLYAACVPEKRIAGLRDAMGVFLQALARRPGPASFETLGDASALIAVRLNQNGLTSERWARLIDGAPPFVAAAVPGDWLAARALSHPRGADGAIDPAFDATMMTKDEMRVVGLAQAWNGEVNVRRAAVEMGIDVPVLTEKLLLVSGDLEGSARQLQQGTVSRTDWTALRQELDGAAPARIKPSPDPLHIDVDVWTDKPSYKAGDLVEVRITVDRACHLTLINVDRDGKAIVLYPNDLEPENLIAPRVAVKVPGANAGYQLRFDRAGRETLVAYCQLSGVRMAGLAPDYEKQRFTILGDWRTFLRTSAEREAAYQRSQQPRSRRGRRGRDEDQPPPVKFESPGPVGRAAVSVTID
jgi:uncharacterized protein DUF4384